jgi:hypothetical protein
MKLLAVFFLAVFALATKAQSQGLMGTNSPASLMIEPLEPIKPDPDGVALTNEINAIQLSPNASEAELSLRKKEVAHAVGIARARKLQKLAVKIDSMVKSSTEAAPQRQWAVEDAIHDHELQMQAWDDFGEQKTIRLMREVNRPLIYPCSFCGAENWARPEDRNAEAQCFRCKAWQVIPLKPMPRWMAFLYRLKRCLAR